ncbi:hypothetical protein [Cohnella sp. CFH 77786]|uniref:hypothetical protein n=1 Tax=Cohnella sp. CFH 77786 TaxID=2662265 RepID=UPI001C60B83B|nr:hypothetical protein [Cohnella sp. CFH 77786]
MTRDDYKFADLQPDLVDEIKIAERKLSERSGQPITLIAYRSDAEQPNDSDGER